MARAALGKMKQKVCNKSREPEFRPFKTFFLHLWYSVYSASHPRPQILRVVPHLQVLLTSAGLVNIRLQCPTWNFWKIMKKILAATFKNLGRDFYAASHRNFMTEPEIKATSQRSQPITLTTRLSHFFPLHTWHRPASFSIHHRCTGRIKSPVGKWSKMK